MKVEDGHQDKVSSTMVMAASDRREECTNNVNNPILKAISEIYGTIASMSENNS